MNPGTNFADEPFFFILAGFCLSRPGPNIEIGFGGIAPTVVAAV